MDQDGGAAVGEEPTESCQDGQTLNLRAAGAEELWIVMVAGRCSEDGSGADQRNLCLSQLSLRKLDVNQDLFISTHTGGRAERWVW